MAEVCIISTGGTIASTVEDGIIDVQSGRVPSFIHEIIEKFKKEGIAIEHTQVFDKLSEDFSCRDIAIVMQAIRKATEQGCRSIVVSHGTDSMHYTASFSEFLFRQPDTKICFTGSFYGPADQRSQAKQATCAAVRTVRSPKIHWGTFVALEKAGARSIQICNALNMKPLDFDDKGLSVRVVSSVCEYSELQHPEIIEAIVSPIDCRFDGVPSEEDLSRAGGLTRLLPAYPGLSGKHLEEAADNTLVYIISAYHSGTGPSIDAFGSGLPTFLRRHPDKLVILAAHPSNSAAYGSVERLIKSGAIVVRDLLPHQIYAYAALTLAMGRSVDELKESLRPITVRP